MAEPQLILRPDVHRIVHLDLKGAPPKIGYYEKLLPLLKDAGATGILLEYEDMFPYWGDLKILACADAYSREEVKYFQQLAYQNNLIVIPLVQTFGHLEFVLKHEKFSHLREMERYPNAICPSLPESMDLIKEMLIQVMQLHPNVKWFHLGADEVWHLGYCIRCQDQMEKNQWTPDNLFLQHAIKVLKFMRNEYVVTNFIMWDDMFRQIDIIKLQACGIGNLIEPMVWCYQSVDFQLSLDMWDKYSATFANIWVASAFKGATGSSQILPNISSHLQNQLIWLNIMAIHGSKFNKFCGFAITGWQRYDHYAVLCELLPVGIPSLVLCLKTLQHGGFSEKLHEKVSKMLGSPDKLDLEIFPRPKEIQQNFTFPGKDVFIAVNLLGNLMSRLEKLTNSETYRGWFSSYNIKYGFANPLHVEQIYREATELSKEFVQLRQRLERELRTIFFSNCVEEWLIEHIDPSLRTLEHAVQDANILVQIGAKPKSASVILRDVPMQEHS